MQDWEQRAEAIRSGQKQSILALLEERGFVHQIVGTREDLDYLLTERRVGAYVGVDPTAPSLHVGHLVPFMALGWLFIHGYQSTFLLGGTTSKIGDPTDRQAARESKRPSERKAALANMHLQLKRLGVTMEAYAERRGYAREWAWRRDVTNNSTWYQKLTLSEFMRVLGSGARLGPLLGRDTVKNRLENGTGMSYAEFSYPLLQAWDWWELFRKGTQIQIGGADQFGNILAGIETVKAMKKVEPVHFESDAAFQRHSGQTATASTSKTPKDWGNINEPIGFTVPLLTTSAGVKFGKTAGNAIWLDQQMTSTFDLYQFFLRSADADVEKYLKLFTFLPIPEIQSIMEEHQLDESKRVAQHKLAVEFVELIHGVGAAQNAQKQHMTMFDKNLTVDSVRASQLEEEGKESRAPGDWNVQLNKYAKPTSAADAPSTHMKLPRSLVVNQSFAKVLWSAGLVSSRAEGSRLIANKGCHIGSKMARGATTAQMGDYLAFTPLTSTKPSETGNYLIDGDLLILRIGKWKMKFITVISDEEYQQAGLTCPGWKEDDDAGREDYNKQVQRETMDFRAERRRERLERQKTREASAGVVRDYQMERE
ncbi:hypothetical protein GJ744_004537 [Endocarpon pusillum]|uniref:Tyrosine--tRNA ligase n=1 Tax=Endocarpon pusillum TaxID=364733 RepID=A0A8H7E9I2_9EURO|nr:hypothetical protein GJ744_004537 [Endocarpon pusillum]